MASISDSSETEMSETESDEFFFKVEEVSSVQAKGKQLFAALEFTDATDRFKTTLECQLDTGATAMCYLIVICQSSIKMAIQLCKQAK